MSLNAEIIMRAEGEVADIINSNVGYEMCIRDRDKEALTEMLRFSIPLIPTSILWWLISGLNRPLLEDYH